MSSQPLRIGELLVQSGVLSAEALAEVLERQRTDRRRLGDLLAERNLVEPRRLAQILSYQLSCPWLSLTNVELAKSLVDLVPRDLAIKHTLVPVHLREKKGTSFLYVATHDPTDETALNEVAEAVQMPVRPMVAITFEIRQALTRYYGAPAPSLTTAPVAFLPVNIPQKAAPAKPPPPLPPKKAAPPMPPGPAETMRLPAVLVLNAPDRFHEQCRIAARSVGATISAGSLMDASEKVKEVRPAAIVVTDDIYGFDRSGLNKLAIESDALLVVWSEDVDASQLQPLLEGAVRRVRRPS